MQNKVDDYTLLCSMEDFFDTLPETLVSPSQLILLKKAANFFPPIIRFALECRLNNHDQVDLQFCIRRGEDDLKFISEWFEGRLSGNKDDEKLISFLRKWADENSPHHKNISEVFLELDINSTHLNIPLLFFDLEPSLSVVQRQRFSAFILKDILGNHLPFGNLLTKIIAVCPEQSYVANLGILFSRDTKVLRVNVKRLSYHSVIGFLETIGYKWIGKELRDYITFVYNYADRITLCLDIGSDIYPKIGFECFWSEQPGKEAYWAYFTGKLSSKKMFNNDKVKAVLDWDHEIFPGEIENWPEHVWMESLKKNENEFSYLKKWVSHLKFSYNPDDVIEVKSYLAYESLWMSSDEIDSKSTDKIELQTWKSEDVEQVIDNGVSYLLSTQQQSGWWKDFYMEVSFGNSDEWVTAYVAYYLSNLKVKKAKSALVKARDILKTRYRNNEGWGYNALIPADGDTTMWVWLFAGAEKWADELPHPFSVITDRYVLKEGGVTSYSSYGQLGKNLPIIDGVRYNGWQIPHNCVTAAHALSGKQYAIDYLITQQNPGGFWYGYWWDGYEYATALITEALFNKDAEKYEKQIVRAVNWATIRVAEILSASSPNSFKLAFLLRILLCADSKNKSPLLEKGIVTRLLNSQEQQGCWESSAILRFPYPSDKNHQTNDNVMAYKDQMKNFTTVTVLDALNKYRLSLLK